MLQEIDWDALSNEWNLQRGSSRSSPYRVNFTTQSPENNNAGRYSLENRLSPLLPARETSAQCSHWTEEAIESVLRSTTNPIGKFLRDINLTARDVLRLDIMPYLEMAPRKQRGKYGKRQDISPQEKLKISRERNREHARATRLRRKVFEVVLDDQLSKLQNSIEVTMRRTRVLSSAQLFHHIAAFFKALDSDAIGDCAAVALSFQLHFQLTHTATSQPEMSVQSALFVGRTAPGECMRGLLEYLIRESHAEANIISCSNCDTSSVTPPRIVVSSSDSLLRSDLHLQSTHCLTPNSAFNVWSPLKDMSPFPLTLSPTFPEEESCMDEAPFVIPRVSPSTSESPEPLSPISLMPKAIPRRVRLAICDPHFTITEGTSAIVPYTVNVVSSDGSMYSHRSPNFVLVLHFTSIEHNNITANPLIVDAHIDVDVNEVLIS